MRFLIAALALSAVPALAQDAPDREPRRIVIEVDSVVTGPDGLRFEIENEVDEDARRVVIRRHLRDGEGADDVVRFRVPGPDGRGMFGALAPFARLGDDGDGLAAVFRGLAGERGVSPETRRRMRELEAESHALAAEARQADGAERADAERRLDAVLGELFEVRAQARREEAARLRERARELTAEADAAEAALREREARRRAIIDARRAELLGDSASDW